MSFATKRLLLLPLLAGCTHAQVAPETTPQALPTAGVYQSFDAKGGGQVLGDTYVVPPGVEPEEIRLAEVNPIRTCWDGSTAVQLWPFTLCPLRPPNIRVIRGPNGTIVVSSSEPPEDDDDDNDPPSNNPPADNPPTDNPPSDDPPSDDPPADDPPANDPPADDPPANDPPTDNNFTEKYDRLEEVYGTRDWRSLPSDDRKDVIDYYEENGGDGDWSGFGTQ